MKNFNKIIFLGLAISLTTTLNLTAQEYAMTTDKASIENIYNEVAESKITPSLYNKNFSYKYQGEEVLVVFNGRDHIEYFNNKKNYIKSKVTWNSKNECSMTFEASNLPRFPFKKGTKMKMKITKEKNGYIYYESTLGGRTWSGKMKQI